MTHDLDTAPVGDDTLASHDLDHDALDAAQLEEPFTVDQVLDMARRVRRTASVCLRADLQAEWDRLYEELTTLVTATGEVIDSDEVSAGEETAESRAIAIRDRLNVLRREMRKAMWHVTFEAMPDEDWALFKRRHKPKDPKADHTEFQHRLVCETAVSPTLSMEQLAQLRKKLGPPAIASFTVKAWEACTVSGLDVPKLPASLQRLAGGQ